MIRNRVPPEIKQRAAGQKVLAWSKVAGDWVVATAGHLHLPGREPVAWSDVVRASWDEPVMELQLPEGMYRLVMEQPGQVPRVVNERVKASVVLQEYVPLLGDKGARFVARRQPGAADIVWRVTLDPGLDPGDPRVRAAADEALEQLRNATGL